ncbi:MAG TPA: HAMP domain-containing sensor histidine kinase [Acidimicrobiales bacterium]|nr:HAMP domain-containing sensor histidine kinase [Acidimicrobiales bacterium]
MAPGEPRAARTGFRLRVLGSFAVVMAAAIAGGLLLQRAVLLRALDRDIDANLREERAELETLASGHNPLTGQPFHGDVRAIFDTFLRSNLPQEGEVYVAFVDGAPYRTTPGPLRLDTIPPLATRWAALTTGERGEVTTDAGPVQYLAVPLAQEGATRGVFVVANFVRGQRQETESAVRIAAGVSGIVLLVATLMAWFVAGRLLRPVRDLTLAAESITHSDLTRRIPAGGDDEIGRLARTFNAMLDRLQAAFTAQRTFIDDAGHELRTPITIVRGHLEVMGDDPEERRHTVALVSDELDRMGRIVDDLLLLAKAEQPDFVRPQTIELADLTTELLVKARALGPRAWRLDGCAEGAVHADPQRVTQAVLNLARNAAEHTGPGADLGLGSALDETGVRLWVRDTGPGIDAADRERIFERFARGRSGPRRSDGAGLGLAIARTVAAAHGGRIDLDTAPGRGSTFTLVLPVAAALRHHEAGAPAESGPPHPATPAPGPAPDGVGVEVEAGGAEVVPWPAS